MQHYWFRPAPHPSNFRCPKKSYWLTCPTSFSPRYTWRKISIDPIKLIVNTSRKKTERSKHEQGMKLRRSSRGQIIREFELTIQFKVQMWFRFKCGSANQIEWKWKICWSSTKHQPILTLRQTGVGRFDYFLVRLVGFTRLWRTHFFAFWRLHNGHFG